MFEEKEQEHAKIAQEKEVMKSHISELQQASQPVLPSSPEASTEVTSPSSHVHSSTKQQSQTTQVMGTTTSPIKLSSHHFPIPLNFASTYGQQGG